MGLYKKYFFRLILVLMVIFGLWFVMAVSTPTLVAPADNANISGTYTFNSTVAGDNAANVTFYWWNSTGSSWKLLCYNETTGAGPFTCSYDTSSIPDGTGYTFNATAENSTGTFASDNNTGITLDNIAPVITMALPSAGWKKGTINIHANATDATTNVTNSTMYFWFGNSTGNFSETLLTSCPYISAAIGFNCSATFDTSDLTDGNHTLWVNASDIMATPNVKNQSKTLIGVDNTNPTISLSESSSTRATITVGVSCGDVTSGVNSCSLSSSSGTVSGSTISGLNCGTSYTITVSTEDNAGNTATSSQLFSTRGCGGGGPAISSFPKKIHSWTLITPGVAAIMKDFDAEFGIRQIQIEVNNEAQNIKITVTKYSAKPAEVSVAKSGKIYQYLQIEDENLENTLDKATVEFRIERSWAAGVGLGKNDIAVFRYNEAENKWNELTITSTAEDAVYYYYDVELESFSYFAIGERVAKAEAGGEEIEKDGISIWIWILIAVVIIAIIVWQMKTKKK